MYIFASPGLASCRWRPLSLYVAIMDELSYTEAAFNVVLRSEIPPREREFLSQIAGKVGGPGKQDLLFFWCKSIDTSHHAYIQMNVIKPGTNTILPIQLPHNYVLLVSGSEARKAIGFASIGNDG